MLRYVRADWLEPNTPEPMDMHVWHLPESIWILKILGFWILDSGSRYTDPSNRCENPESNPVSGIRVLGGFRIPDSGFWVLMSSMHAGS